MSGLNLLFNRATFGTKCKTCLTLAISRIKLLHNRRELQLKSMCQEIAEYLRTGQEAIARIKVEHVIREQNLSAAYEIVEVFCEFLIARIPILEKQRDCPLVLQEAVASIIFASLRCSDVPELLQVRNLLTAKYGKDFVSAAAELRPDCGVNRAIIEKLSVAAPPVDSRLQVLKQIAREYNLIWDSFNTEKEFRKKHEDLLDGSITIPSKEPSLKSSADVPSPKIEQIERLDRSHPLKDSPKKTAPKSSVGEAKAPSDAKEMAQAALATAEHALAAARAAAELSKVKLFAQQNPRHCG